MIEINLAPEYLKKKSKSKALMKGVSLLPKETVIGLVFGVLTILIAIHILLLVLTGMKSNDRHRLMQAAKVLQPQKTNVDRTIDELRKLQGKVNTLETIVSSKDVFWSKVLNEISNRLPRGVWLYRITMENKTLVIQGRAVSKNQMEMLEVHSFRSNLKESEHIQAYFDDFELGLIKTEKLNTTPIAEFTITARLKS